MSNSTGDKFLEEEGEKWDNCIESVITNVGKGILISSLTIFLRRPRLTAISIGFGSGVGVGIGYSSCYNQFNGLKDWKKNL